MTLDALLSCFQFSTLKTLLRAPTTLAKCRLTMLLFVLIAGLVVVVVVVFGFWTARCKVLQIVLK